MAMDKDDWGSDFGVDPDWHHKKIAKLEEQIKILITALEFIESYGPGSSVAHEALKKVKD